MERSSGGREKKGKGKGWWGGGDMLWSARTWEWDGEVMDVQYSVVGFGLGDRVHDRTFRLPYLPYFNVWRLLHVHYLSANV